LPAASGDSLFFDDSGVGLANTDDIAGLSVAGLTFNGTTNAYTLNGTTPLALTGGATALATNSSVAQTVNMPLSFGAATTFTGGAGATSNLAIGGVVTDTAASGNVVLTLLGTGTMTDNLAQTGTAATVITPNAASANWTMLDNPTATPITMANGQFNFISGTINFGSATSQPNLTITATGGSDHTVGNAASTATFNMVNGTMLLKTRLNTVNGNINISGGNLQIWNQFQISNGATTNVSVVNVTGGLLDQRNSSGASSGGTIFVASRGAGTLTISGTGSVVCNTLDVSRGAAAAVGGVASQGILNLNAGGTLTVNTLSTATANTSGTGAGSTAVVNFNGGTLKARSANAIIRNSSGAGTAVPISLVVKAGGAIIDTNTFSMSSAESFQHDVTLIGLDGGLTKKNTGTLTLSGISNYNGNTTIQGGTLALTSAATNNNLGASAKYIVGDSQANSGAILDVTGITPAGGFFVQTGQVLAGFGTINGAVSALVGSIVGPGNSIGTLTENTSLALAGTLSIDLNDADPGINDLLNDKGPLDISAATSAVTFNVTGTPSAAAYVFAKYSSLTGSAFGTVNNLPAGYSIDYNYQGGNQIALVSVPEPAALLSAAVGGLGLVLCRRRKASR
jgi:autotransporter-associated beta strand protein